MDWLDAVARLRARREPGVLVTVVAVRGHAPRNSGAKMVVSSDSIWDTVGGGNMEATAVARSREMIGAAMPGPTLVTVNLSDKAPSEFGVQCCGGEVTMLLEPVKVTPSVAIFGMGHVGLELARILSRHDLELTVVDSRAEMLENERLRPLTDGSARLHVRHAPVPESVLSELPANTHVLIMTHDHAEDVALCDVALRQNQLASIGLIGSSAKWVRFRKMLTSVGHTLEDLERITTPIGLPELTSKEPATIAVGVAATLLMKFETVPA
ncbi:MAG: xanthine dehydrogenase accessory protein XdhC [Terrimesophilobacter sp.]